MKQLLLRVLTRLLLIFLAYTHAAASSAEYHAQPAHHNTHTQLTPSTSHVSAQSASSALTVAAIAWNFYHWLTHSSHKQEDLRLPSDQHAQLHAMDRREAYCALHSGTDDVYTRSYALDHAAHNFLRMHTRDDRCYTTCTGNVLQHALHEECITLVTNAARLDNRMSAYQDMLAHAIDTGRICAHENDIDTSTRMLDWAHALYRYAQAVTQGIAQGAEQTIHTLTHPRQFIAQLSRSSHEIVCCTMRIFYECGLIETLIDIDNDALLDAYITDRGAHLNVLAQQIKKHARALIQPQGIRSAVASTTHMLLTGKCLHAIGKLFNFAARAAPYVHKRMGNLVLTDQCTLALAGDAFLINAAQETAQLALHAAEAAAPAAKVLAAISAYEPPTVCIDRLGKKFPRFATDNCKPLIHILKGEVTSKGKLLGLHHDHLGYLEAQGKIRVLKTYENGMYEAEVFYNDKWREKTFFPKHWTPEQVISELDKAVKQASEWEMNRGRKVVEVVMHGKKVWIVAELDGCIVTAYPVFESKVL